MVPLQEYYSTKTSSQVSFQNQVISFILFLKDLYQLKSSDSNKNSDGMMTKRSGALKSVLKYGRGTRIVGARAIRATTKRSGALKFVLKYSKG
jgi:hypothetical protein